MVLGGDDPRRIEMPNAGPREMQSTQLESWDVLKCTTQDLQDMLNGYEDPWQIHQIQYVGGRDWVVIAKVEWDSLEAKCEAFGEDISTWDYGPALG